MLARFLRCDKRCLPSKSEGKHLFYPLIINKSCFVPFIEFKHTSETYFICLTYAEIHFLLFDILILYYSFIFCMRKLIFPLSTYIFFLYYQGCVCKFLNHLPLTYLITIFSFLLVCLQLNTLAKHTI